MTVHAKGEDESPGNTASIVASVSDTATSRNQIYPAMKNPFGFILIFTLIFQTGLMAQDHLLILNKTGGTAWIIDAMTGEKLKEYPTGTAPHEVAVSPDNNIAVITNYGEQEPGNSLTVINLEQEKVQKTITLGPYKRPHGIEWFSDNRRVALSAEGGQAVLIVDIEKGTVLSAIETNEKISHMVEIGPEEELLYVTNIGSGSLTAVDLNRGKVLKTVSTAEGEGTEGITFVKKQNEIWVTNRVKNTISVVDARTLQVIQTLQSSSFPIRAETSPNEEFVAVSNARSSDISIFDTESKKRMELITTLTPGVTQGIPIGLTFSNDGNRLFVANSNANQIVVIDTSTWKVMETFETGPTPDGIAFIPGE